MSTHRHLIKKILAHEGLFAFFHQSTQYLLILPLLVIFCILYVIVTKPQSIASRPALYPLAVGISPTPMTVDEGLAQVFKSAHASPATSLSSKPPLPTLDLVGPWQCSTSEVRLMIAEGRVHGTLTQTGTTKSAILTDDCIYVWEGAKAGTKQCGIAPYLELVKPMLSSGESVNQLIQGLGTSVPGMPDANSVMASCVKKPVPASEFVLPRGVKWTEGSLF